MKGFNLSQVMRRWSSSTLVVLLTGFLTLAGIGPASAVTVSSPTYSSTLLGNNGGSSVTMTPCASGSVVVAVYSGGTDSQSFGFKCATVNEDGSIGATLATVSWARLDGGASAADTSNGFSSTCPSGKAAIGIRLSQGSYLEAAQIECASGPLATDKVWGDATSTRSYNFGSGTCSSNGFISGFIARTGGSIDGVYLGCSSISNYSAPPTVSSTSAPSGTLAIGQSLTSQITFGGIPTPTISSNKWQRSLGSTGTWSDIAGATASTYLLTASDVGYMFRSVATASNTSGSASGTSDATNILQISNTSAPDLAAASDSGSSSTDNLTNDATPTISASSLTTGALVTVTATRAALSVNCSFTASSASGSCDLPQLSDGQWTISAVQALNGQTSVAQNLNITIDTVAPTAPTITLAPTAIGAVLVTFASSESLAGLVASKFVLSGDSTAWSKGNPAIAGTASAVTLPLTNSSLTAGNLVIKAEAGAFTDLAGNALAQDATQTFGVDAVLPT